MTVLLADVIIDDCETCAPEDAWVKNNQNSQSLGIGALGRVRRMDAIRPLSELKLPCPSFVESSPIFGIPEMRGS
jgi:hypothetical protein